MPAMALTGILFSLVNKPITTIHNGNIAPIMAPSPAVILYCSANVLKPLLTIKFRKLSTRTGIHSLPFGKTAFLYRKKLTYNNSAMICRILANCKAGIRFTPSFDAIQVVPHKIQTNARQKIAFALVPFL